MSLNWYVLKNVLRDKGINQFPKWTWGGRTERFISKAFYIFTLGTPNDENKVTVVNNLYWYMYQLNKKIDTIS